MKNSQELIKIILEDIPGDKIVTIATDGVEEAYDIHQNKIGYHPSHEYLFTKIIQKSMKDGAGLTIREFRKDKIPMKTENKKTMMIPKKNMYGVYLGENTWKGLSKQEIWQAYHSDHDNQMNILDGDPSLVFCDLPVNRG